MEETNAASQQVSESASQLAVAMEGTSDTLENLPADIVATEDESFQVGFAELDRRIRELEAAMGDMRSVKASASVGRKTSASMMAKGAEASDMDEAFRSLSVEQRIAVKSGLMRAGLL
jgi:paraquat-inducible protein B